MIFLFFFYFLLCSSIFIHLLVSQGCQASAFSWIPFGFAKLTALSPTLQVEAFVPYGFNPNALCTGVSVQVNRG